MARKEESLKITEDTDPKLAERVYWEPERASIIKIGLREYPMLMTLRATKEITRKYGGLEDLAAEVFADKWEEALDDFCWLVALLINQCISIINLRERANFPYLKPEDVEIQLGPVDMPACSEALAKCLLYGTARHVESEEEEAESKN